ncbi:hypothetical protein ACFSSA_10605 [Luteolibacter algae]|uniref:AsmA-like C-terminal domain-containing protein n=1 Tax=Luteolibacter algae TaxID=454151 RepID=A0ABW5DB63_9BACT
MWLILVAMIPLSIGGLYWANKTGLPEDWRKALEQEISKHGAHVEIGSLTYIPLQGFVATDVSVFAEAERLHEISKLERVQLALDYANLAGGQFRIRKIQMKNARLALPVDPKNPAGESLHFSNIYGTIFMPSERLIEVRNAIGQVGGIDVTLSARLLGKARKKGGPEEEKNEGRRREMIANIINEMQHWNFDGDLPPRVHVDIEGELSDKTTLRAAFRVDAPSIEKKQYRLKNFTARGKLANHLLTLGSFSAEDARGTITGSADYQLLTRDGRFDMESSIDIPRLLKSWLATPLNVDLLSGGKQQLRFAGDFNLSDLKAPIVHLTGHALCESIMFRGVVFDSVDTWFSWQNGDLFLRDLVLNRPDGKAEGKVLIEKNLVRLQLHSTLPAPLYKPFFTGQPLEKVIGDFTENADPLTEIFLEGSFDANNRHSWAYSGHGVVKNLSYRGVPVKQANCSFILNHYELDFYDGSVTFDYTDYPLRKAYNGPASSTASVGRIRYDAKDKSVGVEKVVGDIWAAPLVRFFAPSIADDLEQYRFHQPPSLSGSGKVDVTPAGRTDLTVKFSTKGQADYKFLGEVITLGAPKATVKIEGGDVHISNLGAAAFGGDIAGDFHHGPVSKLSGELSWSKLSMPALSSTYGFELKGGGEVTGRIDFSMFGGDVSTMDGEGLIAMEKAELFSVPVFGPLSNVISKVVDDRRAGFERAKSAFCTFDIRKGILRTRDFQTATSSVTFAGDGAVDLSEQTIDFTIRLNARGLLGLITLPLRPFYGLFQFRGSGPIKNTTWENVHFTSPPDEQNQILLAPPKAKVVGE